MEMPKNTEFNVDYIQKALAHAYKCDELKVESFKLELKKQTCEYFCSDIYQCNVKYRKTPESNIEMGKYIIKDVRYMFSTDKSEKLMFQKILPAMDEILGRAFPDDPNEYKLSANCLYCESFEWGENYLLEDLNTLDYTHLDRQKGLNLHEAEICLQKMAQFHAASMILIEEQPDLVEELPSSHFTAEYQWYPIDTLMKDSTKYTADVFTKEMPEIATKMEAQMSQAFMRRMRSIMDPENSGIKVIIHGEPWINNMLMNRAKEKSIFMDFQHSCLGSPGVDLNFFFHTSPEFSEAFDKRAELLEHYCKCLRKTLRSCGYVGSIPDFALINSERIRCAIYSYYAAILYLPIRCASPEASESFNVQTLLNEKAMLKKRQQLFANGPLLKQLRTVLINFNRASVLEFHEPEPWD
ncbi:uncharacterized protein [Drosophila tropicalis]|uniref:uncharacterized protein isoform X1 n=3 Tax=Drosophila tropicalis TaxID=46794 RepID=UPI0035ABCE34